MRLKTAHITNFRCIEDSIAFDVDNVTCLVGKNESGKTTLLQALHKLNPHRAEDGDFDRETEYPRRFVNLYKERHPNAEAEVLNTEWELTKEEQGLLIERLGPAAAVLTTVRLRKGYDNELTWWFDDLAETGIVRALLDGSDLFDEERADLLQRIPSGIGLP